ncbi:MAG: VPLPA-CTERM sorting domain-containing protein [Gammaproteobacteria bacterium]
MKKVAFKHVVSGVLVAFASASIHAASLDAYSQVCNGYVGSAANLQNNCWVGNRTGDGVGIAFGGSGAGSSIDAPYSQDAQGRVFAASAQVLQDYGVFRGRAFVEATDPSPSIFKGTYFGRAVGTAIDTLTITGGSGVGSLQMTWTVTGSTAASSGASASMGISVSSSSTAGSGFGSTLIYGGGTYNMIYDHNGLPFVFGAPLTLNTMSTVNANAGYDRYNLPATFSGTATASFDHTAILTGIEAFDQYGDPIKNLSITSASGTHYPIANVAAVPLPAAAWLLISGLSGLTLTSVRRRIM